MLTDADLAVVHCVRIGGTLPNWTTLWIRTDAQLEEFAQVIRHLQEALLVKGTAAKQLGRVVGNLSDACFDVDLHPVTMAHTPEGRNLSNGLSVYIDWARGFIHIEFAGRHKMIAIAEFAVADADALVAELTDYTPSA